ncbi:tyrosine-type recombinase/integrase [Virgibacillus proomii]|uniref:tyrosine-type recombinase/integrase n=1 Tax=Virgibacillus proomii TaxID=84407 RepID=UPI001C0FAC4F|nr:tyrosine-type recombinase/integrase [Virgibacillus proomii]MBU5265740.1 tyrosine-type recombinase/integrase [Virgibacillus proomii]
MGKKIIGTRKPNKRDTDRQNVQQLYDVQQTDITVSEALEMFIQAKEAEGVRSRTVEEYRRHIRYLLDYTGNPDFLLKELTPNIIRKYIMYLLKERKTYEEDENRKSKKEGLSPNTVNIRLRTLRTMCRFWYTEGITTTNAMATIKPVRTDQVEEVQGLSEEEISRILGSLDERQYAQWRDKTLIYLLLDSGLRINEAVTLTIDQVNTKFNEVTVTSEVAKNRKYRDVPISREVTKRLLELHQESKEYFGESNLIFLNAYGEPFNSEAFRKRLNRLKKKIGMETLHPHQFRHTFARDYLLNGGDLFTLQKILDHSDIKTTRKYIQMNSDHIRQQHSKHSPLRKYTGTPYKKNN